jgi:NitT/TauT family transport system substrate-binding protein
MHRRAEFGGVMSRRVITRARASSLLFGGATLCAIRLPARAQTMATVRIGTVPSEFAAEVYYAKDMGFFAKAGIDTDIQPMQNGSAIAAAIASNAVDIGFATLDALATIHQNNIPLVIIAPAAEYVSPATARIAALVLPARSPVQQAKDLNGKIIAVAALRSLQDTATSAWIDQHGGDSSTIRFVELPFPAMPAALDAGRVDAAFVVEPFLGVAKKNGRVLAYVYDAISKHFLIGAWFTTPQWEKNHPDLVNRFAAAMHETAVWANKNQAKSGEILAKYTKIEPAVIATMARAHYAEQLTAASMQPSIDVSAKYDKFSTFPAQELIYVPSR